MLGAICKFSQIFYLKNGIVYISGIKNKLGFLQFRLFVTLFVFEGLISLFGTASFVADAVVSFSSPEMIESTSWKERKLRQHQ
jgi:hypothetical protein